VKGGDGEEEEEVDAAAALPHAVAPVGAPDVYCCGGGRSVYCCGGAKETKGGDGKKENMATRLLRCRKRRRPRERPSRIRAAAPRRDRDATATRLLRLRTRWLPWERQERRRRGFTASGEVKENRAGARSSAGSVKTK
jgi:hypothetical protein